MAVQVVYFTFIQGQKGDVAYSFLHEYLQAWAHVGLCSKSCVVPLEVSY